MSPSLALAIWFVLVLALFLFDPAEYKGSPGLWVPVIWMFILGSRTPAMWLGVSSTADAVQALEQGNPLDRTIFLLLALAAFTILVSRSFPWQRFVEQNAALACLLAFGLLSVAWSDFPVATFKKWFRDLGVYIAVLVVLSDPRPLEAVRLVLRRVCYLLVPLSIVLIKYYPGVGRTWSPWGGLEETGVSTTKNMLGLLCLLGGVFFFWDTVTIWQRRIDVRVRRVIWVNIAFMAMILWLLTLSQSKTSTICLALGCSLIAVTHSNFGRRHSAFVKAMGPTVFCAYVVLALGFGMAGQISEAVGRNSSMSDRTRIWEVLLSVPINPVLGTGYQSFWLGPRVQWVWARLTGDNVLSAHNGFLQTYLELGLLGLVLLSVLLIGIYRKICRLEPLSPIRSLALSLWTVVIFYNVTEAMFGASLLFITLLMASLTVPRPLALPRSGEPVKRRTGQNMSQKVASVDGTPAGVGRRPRRWSPRPTPTNGRDREGSR